MSTHDIYPIKFEAKLLAPKDAITQQLGKVIYYCD